MKKFIEFTFNYWKWVIGVVVLLTIICGYFFLKVKVDNAIETLTVDSDPSLITLQRMEHEFGSDEFIVISFKGNDIFTPKVLNMINRITENIENVKNVEKVLSLTNAFSVKSEPGTLGTSPLIPENYLHKNNAEELKKRVLKDKMYSRILFFDDGQATSIIAWMLPLGNDDSKRWDVVTAIKKIIQEESETENRKFYFYGMPVYQKKIMDVMIRDQLTLPVILSLIVGLLLFIFFNDIKMVILPFLLIGLTGIWALGLLVAFGSTLNYVTFIIPIVVLIVCLCDSVHIISQYKESFA